MNKTIEYKIRNQNDTRAWEKIPFYMILIPYLYNDDDITIAIQNLLIWQNDIKEVRWNKSYSYQGHYITFKQ